MLLLDYVSHLLRLIKIKYNELRLDMRVKAAVQSEYRFKESRPRFSIIKYASWLVALSVYTLFIFRAEDIHRSFIRKYVGSRVYQLRIPGGGGTGFAVKAPSGKTYILTNDHICSPAKNSFVFIKFGMFNLRSEIVARSPKTDLCLVTAPLYEVGLDLASELPDLGDPVVAVGHPALDLLTVSNKGEIISVIDTVLSSEAENEKECDLTNPKFRLVEREGTKYCILHVPSAYSTSVLVKSGNSGSPLVNFYGEVVGVVAGMDRYNWALAVSLDDIKEFLEDY